MSTYDIVIKGGTIIDGLLTPRYKADVGIKDGRIARSSAASTPPTGPRSSTHPERSWPRLRRRAHALRQPGLLGPVVHDVRLARRHHGPDRQLRIRVRSVQGRGPGPSDAVAVAQRGGATQDDASRDAWDWETFPEFLDSVERTPKGVNVMSLVPARAALWVRDRRRRGQRTRASDEELDRMCQLLAEAMEAGGLRLELPDLRRRRQRAARLRRHADGDRRDDRAGNRRLLPGSAQTRSRNDADHRPARDGRPHRSRERPAHHLECPGAHRCRQPARRVPLPTS